MLLKSHIFKLLLSFAIGILMANMFQVHWVILFTIWSSSFIILMLSIHFGRKEIRYRKWIGSQVLIVFFLSGAFSYQYNLPESQRKHFSNYYLEDDKLVTEVLDFEHDTSSFQRVIVEVKGVHGNDDYATLGKLLCYLKTPLTIRKGDILFLNPRLLKIENQENPGGFKAKEYWNSKGIYHLSFADERNVKRIKNGTPYDNFWHDSREGIDLILGEHLSAENRVVARALVLGDKSGLSNAQRESYAQAGAMHVLAVSGMHVGILLGFLQWIFYRVPFLRRRGLFVVSSLIIIWGFAFLTGMSSSVLRATIMFTVLAIGQLRGYSFFSLNALFLSGILILFIDPGSLFNIGFQLSFLAMMGISFFFGPIRNLINSRYKLINYFWDGTALGIAAQIGTIPISLFYFHQFPNYFILTNLGLIILAAAALISVIVFLILSWVPLLSELMGELANTVFTSLNFFIDWINSLPAAISKGLTPSVVWVISVYLLLVLSYHFWTRKKIRGFRLVVLSLFLFGLILIVKREFNYWSTEIVFPNQKVQSILVKSKGKVVCVVPDDDYSRDKVDFVTSGYAIMMGAEERYISLSSNQAIKLDQEIQVKRKLNDFEVHFQNKKILFTKKPSRLDAHYDLVVGHQVSSNRNVDTTNIKGAVRIAD